MGFVKGLICGAALMYFLDPDRGRSRRAFLRDKSLSYRNELARTRAGAWPTFAIAYRARWPRCAGPDAAAEWQGRKFRPRSDSRFPARHLDLQFGDGRPAATFVLRRFRDG
jgi:hypothetical protein